MLLLQGSVGVSEGASPEGKWGFFMGILRWKGVPNDFDSKAILLAIPLLKHASSSKVCLQEGLF